MNINDTYNEKSAYDLKKTVPDVKIVSEWGEDEKTYRQHCSEEPIYIGSHSRMTQVLKGRGTVQEIWRSAKQKAL